MLLMAPASKELVPVEQKPNKPLVRESTLDAPTMFKRPNRLSKLCRRMFRNHLILVIDPPGSIKELSDFDLSLGIGASEGTGRKIQNQTSNPNAVIIAYDRAVAEANESIQIELWGTLRQAFSDSRGGSQNDD